MSVGLVNKLETFATLDGDGIRVAVFMQGCPLSCNFCHNPETQKIFSNDFENCADKQISLQSNGKTNYKFTAYTPETLAAKLLRYKPYLTDGGVTFTGGEPLLYADFLLKVCEILKNNGINIALDTSCSLFNDSAKKLVSACDTVIADLKFSTDEEYKKYTGGSLKTVLTNLDFIKSQNKKLVIRTVLIPNINDNEAAVKKYIDLLSAHGLLKVVSYYELLSFHTMGFSKYDDYGMENKLKDVPALDETVRDRLQAYADNLIKTLLN